MARRGSKAAAQHARIEQERARVYRARADWHAGQQKRRLRDNVIGSLVGALIVIASFTSQAVHAAVTAPEPEPSAPSEPAEPTTPEESEPPSEDEEQAPDDEGDSDAEGDDEEVSTEEPAEGDEPEE